MISHAAIFPRNDSTATSFFTSIPTAIPDKPQNYRAQNVTNTAEKSYDCSLPQTPLLCFAENNKWQVVIRSQQGMHESDRNGSCREKCY